MYRLSLLLNLTILAACGGGTGGGEQVAGQQVATLVQPPSAPASQPGTSPAQPSLRRVDFAETHGLKLQALPYENHMGQGILPGQPVSCTPLIVPFSVRASVFGFPQNLSVKSVSVTKPGAPVWEAAVSVSETGLTTRWASDVDWISIVGIVDGKPPLDRKLEEVLAGIARGCREPAFREGDELVVGILVTTGDAESVIYARAKLGYAY